MATDIIDLIQQDHQEFRGLFSRIDSCPVNEREDLFRQLVAELARHEAAEESLIHPTLRDEVEGGQAIAENVLEEESGAEKLLADMEKMDPAGDEFMRSFRTLREEVLEHAEHEERDEHPSLRAALDEPRLVDMGEKFQKIKDLGPTHPHPSTPQAPEVRAAAGPVAGAFDRMRDKVKEMLSS